MWKVPRPLTPNPGTPRPAPVRVSPMTEPEAPAWDDEAPRAELLGGLGPPSVSSGVSAQQRVANLLSAYRVHDPVLTEFLGEVDLSALGAQGLRVFERPHPAELQKSLEAIPLGGPLAGKSTWEALWERFGEEDASRLVAAISEVQGSMLERARSDPSQKANWEHTAKEIAFFLEGEQRVGAQPDAAALLLGSVLSDSNKRFDWAESIVLHPLHAAQAALELLCRHSFSDAEAARALAVCLAHGWTPAPGFMPLRTRQLLVSSLEAAGIDPDAPDVARGLDSVRERMDAPYAHLAPNRREVSFDADERALLQRLGLSHWPVPAPDDVGALLVCYADLAQYADLPTLADKYVGLISWPGPGLDGPATAYDALTVAPAPLTALDALDWLPPPLREDLLARQKVAREAVDAAWARTQQWALAQFEAGGHRRALGLPPGTPPPAVGRGGDWRELARTFAGDGGPPARAEALLEWRRAVSAFFQQELLGASGAGPTP